MIKIQAPAKINLSLDVIADRLDGYHEVDLIMQTISLADEIILKPSERLELDCTEPKIPVDRRNLAWRAVELIWKETGIQRGISIQIKKNIPMAAGLAGGSADAAAVLVGLNKFWNLGLTQEKLLEIGLKLGADVPFCILQQTARAQGIGEKLTLIDSKLECNLLIITPNIEVSTARIYQKIKVANIRRHPNTDGVIEALEKADLALLTIHWGNVLEEVVFKEFPIVAEIQRMLVENGMKYVLMSGSGPTVFVLDPPAYALKRFQKNLPPDWFTSLSSFKK